MATTTTHNKFVTLTPSAARLAGKSGAEFDRLARAAVAPGTDATIHVSIESSNGDRTAVSLPEGALALIASVLHEASRGRSVRVISTDAEVTTQEAADILSVSRPYLVKLLQQGKIPFRSVGARRRIILSELLEYKEREAVGRLAGVDELAAESQRLEMY